MEQVYLDAPNLGSVEKEYLCKCVDSSFVSTAGPFVPEFEQKLAELTSGISAAAVQSGTAALHIALHSLGIGPGDEVIVPSLTFIATVNPVLYTGARPVIVDVDPLTWNINPSEIEKAITPRTKALIPVHLYGNPCNMEAIMEIAGKYNLYVIEDATESLGASYKGRSTGTFGHFGCLSFNGNKLITTGGGGAILTDDAEKAKHINFLVNQARDAKAGYYHPEMGFNYRMTNIEAALGLAQLTKLQEFLQKKREFKDIYQDILGDLPYLNFPQEYEDALGSHWLTCIRFTDNTDVDWLARRLAQENIPTRKIFMPVGEMPYLRPYSKPCPEALKIFKQGICLPGSTLNSNETIEKVALTIRRVLVG